MNMQAMAEQMRQHLLKVSADNYAKQLAAIGELKKTIEIEHQALVEGINDCFGVTITTDTEISEEDT
jgi:hypothetical protein